MTTIRTRWLAAGSAAVLLLAACNDAQPTPSPELAFCDSLDTLAQSVASLQELDAQSTVDEVQEGIEAVGTAAQGVRDAAGDLAQSQMEAIQTAADELRDYGDTIEGSETIEQVIAGLAEQIAALQAARLEAGTVHCGLAEAQAAASAVAEQVEAAASAAAERVEAAASAVAEALASALPEPAGSPAS
jgi:hypothetical protein